jgi:hypothetical protein
MIWRKRLRRSGCFLNNQKQVPKKTPWLGRGVFLGVVVFFVWGKPRSKIRKSPEKVVGSGGCFPQQRKWFGCGLQNPQGYWVKITVCSFSLVKISY